MKKIILSTLLLMFTQVTYADLRLFVCEPEWAALATELGGDNIKVSSATNALQDPHYIQARPSLISKMGRADLIVCSGAQLEIGWLPMLLRKANNPDVLPGGPGFLEASRYVKRLDVTLDSDRSQGDVHPQGNPHIQTNPHNILLVAVAMTERLVQLDSTNADTYEQNLSNFRERWTLAITNWENRASVLQDKRVIPTTNRGDTLRTGWDSQKLRRWNPCQVSHPLPVTWQACWIALATRAQTLSSAHPSKVRKPPTGYQNALVFLPFCCL